MNVDIRGYSTVQYIVLPESRVTRVSAGPASQPAAQQLSGPASKSELRKTFVYYE
jgi:hypothetical protein